MGEIHVDSLGMCDSCMSIELSQEELDAKKEELLQQLNERQKNWE